MQCIVKNLVKHDDFIFEPANDKLDSRHIRNLEPEDLPTKEPIWGSSQRAKQSLPEPPFLGTKGSQALGTRLLQPVNSQKVYKKCTLYLYLLLQKLMQYHTIVLLNNHNKEYNYILVHLTILNNDWYSSFKKISQLEKHLTAYCLVMAYCILYPYSPFEELGNSRGFIYQFCNNYDILWGEQ